MSTIPSDVHSKAKWNLNPSSNLRNALSLPPKWLHRYDEFVTKNASQVSQMESALRSLTYIIPGRFRDAEIASETLHSSVQLLSLYHDTLLLRALSLTKLPISKAQTNTLHSRYTRFWTAKSSLYRRVALVLQIVQYTELLLEMAAKRRGERIRWRVVVSIEAVKAFCRLLLLRITRSRPLVTPVLPERPPVSEPEEEEEEDGGKALAELMGEEPAPENGDANGSAVEKHDGANGSGNGHALTNGHPVVPNGKPTAAPRASASQEWSMPRTGLSLPSLPAKGDISGYLLSRVLTADDIKPATKLLQSLQGSAHAAEIIHILAPLIYAIALSRSSNKKSWTPWLIGLSLQVAARQLAQRSREGDLGRGLRATALEREEWTKRNWAMGWWVMRGAAYENVAKGVVGGVRRRVPAFVGGILEDYEYLWENYYFSTSDS